jgi:LysM repeat protein
MAAYVPTGPDLVKIQAVDPPGPTVLCRHGDGVAKFSSAAGWQMTKRPKRTSMTEWMGADPYTLVVPVQFGDGWSTGIAVDPVVEVLRGIMRNPVGPRNQPAVVQITCPLVPLTWLRWVIADLTPKDQLVNDGGGRYFASYDITFYQWEPTDLVISSSSGQTSAQRAAASTGQSSGMSSGATITAPAPAASGWTYTVKQGDTLSSIAARQLGNASRWQEIRTLNNIRDPNMINVGQVLRMPGSPPIPGYAPGQGHGPSGTSGGVPLSPVPGDLPGYGPGQGHGPSGVTG